MLENEFQVFKKDGFGSIRTIMLNHEIWFDTEDICNILSQSATYTLYCLEDFEKTKLPVSNSTVDVMNESGLFSVLSKSENILSMPLKKWITTEVIPEIRTSYSFTFYSSIIKDVQSFMKNTMKDMKVVYAQINNIEETVDEHSDILLKINENLENVIFKSK